jgi:hypothetical protein
MKIVGIFLVIGLLFSYVPIIPVDGCPEANHMGSMKIMDCGYAFHCPMISDGSLQEPFSLPLNGWLPLPTALPKADELTHLIFHPPKNLIISIP